jgi:hypothetical protein
MDNVNLNRTRKRPIMNFFKSIVSSPQIRIDLQAEGLMEEKSITLRV